MSGHIVNHEALAAYISDLMQTQGVPADEAQIIGEHLVEAEMFGVTSHGVSRTSTYMKRLHEGVVNAKWSYRIDAETQSIVKWDACNSMGMVTGVKAMQEAIDRAKESGICLVAANHSNHFGMAGYYARMAAQQGMLGICITNAPPNIAPTGSSRAYMGTNPIALAAPRNGRPVILDMATSVVAMGKLVVAQKLGKAIPEGWALTAEGKPTTDPNEGVKGTMMPIGGYKGYGLALFVDIFCGILADAETGPHMNNLWHDFVNPQNVGHCFCAIDISKFLPLSYFTEKMERMIAEIKALPKIEGVSEIYMPEEIEFAKRDRAVQEGIPLADAIYNELAEQGRIYGVEMKI